VFGVMIGVGRFDGCGFVLNMWLCCGGGCLGLECVAVAAKKPCLWWFGASVV
jgi:hypothetical protein